MPEMNVEITDLTAPDSVKAGGEIREHEFSAEFTVERIYSNPGCYAIFIRLVNYHVATPNEDVGYTSGGLVKCYCFQSQQKRSFFVGGAGGAPKGKPALKSKNPKSITLEPIEGTWPTGDFPTNRMQLMVEVKVYECHRGDCSGDECEDTLHGSSIADRSPVGGAEKKDTGRTRIVPGRDYVEEGAKAGVGMIPKPK